MNYKACPVCGRLHTYRTKESLCKKHYHQLIKYGKTLDNNPRTKFDTNEIRIKGDIAELDLYDLNGNVIKTAIFDAEDYPIVSRYKWDLTKSGYCRSGISSIFLHRLVIGCPNGSQVDHINLNPMDNRKCNLRVCQNGLNQANRYPYNKWNIKGIEQHNNGKWSAYIRKDNKQYHSPTFNSKEEAIYARYIMEQFIYPNDVLTQHIQIEINDNLRENVAQRTLNKLNN